MKKVPASRTVPASKRAAGITIAFGGGLSLISGLNVLDQGTLNLGSLVEMNFGSGPAGVKIYDGGVSLHCNPQWSVGPFAVRSKTELATDGSRPPSTVEAVAAAIADQAPSGSILLIGSGDGIRSLARNRELAAGRAETVRARLAGRLASIEKGQVAREILLGNEALAYADPKGGDLAIPQGLARLLYGEEEVSNRSVQACVLRPSPPRVETWGAAEPETTVWKGLTGGLIMGVLLTSIAFLAGGRARERRSREQETEA